MADDTEASTPDDFNWSNLTTPASARASNTPAPTGGNIPPFPPNTGLILGRLPIRGDTATATVQLPDPLKGVHCAAVTVNSGVLSDCYRTARNTCVPAALQGYPINDREFKVILDSGGDHTTKGLGWTPGTYPGALPETRSIEVGVPYVEVWALVGVSCGCDSENWASDNEWGQ